MEWIDWAALILVIVTSILIGLVWGWFWHKTVVSDISAGTLKIYTSDPDGPYLFLELHEDIGTIAMQSHAFFEIDTIVSQE